MIAIEGLHSFLGLVLDGLLVSLIAQLVLLVLHHAAQIVHQLVILINPGVAVAVVGEPRTGDNVQQALAEVDHGLVAAPRCLSGSHREQLTEVTEVILNDVVDLHGGPVDQLAQLLGEPRRLVVELLGERALLVGVGDDGATGEVLVLGEVQSLREANHVSCKAAACVGTEDCGGQEVGLNGGLDVVLEGVVPAIGVLQQPHKRRAEDSTPLTVLRDLEERVAVLQRDAVIGILGSVVQLFPLVIPIRSLEDAVEDSLEEHGRHSGAAQSLRGLLPDGGSVGGINDAAYNLVDTLDGGVPVGDPRVDDLTEAALAAEVHGDFRGVFDALQAGLVSVAEPVNGGQILSKASLRLGCLVEGAHLLDTLEHDILLAGHHLHEALVVVIVGRVGTAQSLEPFPVLAVLLHFLRGLGPVLGERQTGDGVDHRGGKVAGHVTQSKIRVDTGNGGLHESGKVVASLHDELLNVVGQVPGDVSDGLVHVLADVGSVLTAIAPTGQLVVITDLLETGLLGVVDAVFQITVQKGVELQSLAILTGLPVPVKRSHVGERAVLVQHCGVDDVHVQSVDALQADDLAHQIGEAVLDVHHLRGAAAGTLHSLAHGCAAHAHEVSPADAVLVGTVGGGIVWIHTTHGLVLCLGQGIADGPVTHEQVPPLVDAVGLLQQPRILFKVLLDELLAGCRGHGVAVLVSEDGLVLSLEVVVHEPQVLEGELLGFLLTELLDFLVGHRDETGELLGIHITQPLVLVLEGLQSRSGAGLDAHAVDVVPVQHEVLQQGLLVLIHLLTGVVPAQEDLLHGASDAVTGAVDEAVLEDVLDGGGAAAKGGHQSTGTQVRDLALSEPINSLSLVDKGPVCAAAEGSQALSAGLEALNASALSGVLADRVHGALLNFDLGTLLREQIGVAEGSLRGVALEQ